MSRLLRANFMRLKFSLAFWVCVIVSGFSGFFLMLMSYFGSYGQPFDISVFFFCGTMLMWLMAAFIPLFIGTEYSDLTIRNKLIAGHTKTAVYFSNLITVLICSFVIYTAYWLPAVSAGAFLGGNMGIPVKLFCAMLFTNALAITAMTAVLVMPSMLISRKSSAVTAALIGTLILVFAAEIFGIVSVSFATPAEAVLSVISLFFTEVSPFGQAMQIDVGKINGLFPVYSISVTAFAAAAGAFIFKRKDLK